MVRMADLDASGDELYIENVNVSTGVLYNRRSPDGLDEDLLLRVMAKRKRTHFNQFGRNANGSSNRVNELNLPLIT